MSHRAHRLVEYRTQSPVSMLFDPRLLTQAA